jgi:fibronectin type 3 domain-containing protein
MKQFLSRFGGSPRNLLQVAFIVVFAGIGTYALLSSHAATGCNVTATSVSDAISKVSSAASGNVICMAPGSYGSITLTGTHSANVTFEPDPSQDPNGAGKVTFSGINVTGSFITVRNFYSTGGLSFLPPATNDTADHNDVTDGLGGYGMDVSCNTASQPCTFITMTGNRIHNLAGTDGTGSGSSCNYGSDGDGLRLDGWANVTITGNEETGVEQVNGGVCEGHTDCLQSYNANKSTQGFDFEHNYIHDNQCEGPPFLKDGDVTSNVTVKDNLDVRSTNKGLTDTALFVVGNTTGAIIRNNAYLTSGSTLQGSGSATVDHNIFSQFNISGYTLTENNNIFTDGNQWSFTVNSTDTPPPTAAYGTKYTPAYKCGSSCGNGTVAGDDYELASNPNGIGIDWAPASQTYGPVDTSGGGGGNPPPVNTPPTASVTAPANNATVNGTATVAATAAATTSGASISSVQFKLDGNNLGSADTASPYTYSWNSATASNGMHTLTAVATDSNNLTTTSSSVTVTVSNTTTGTTSCFSSPGSCGYPDPAAGNVGVANCSALTASGSVTTSTDGQTIQNLNITGTITVNNKNVTINNVCVTTNGGGRIPSSAIVLNAGATGNTISNSTIAGANTSNQSVESAIAFDHSGTSNNTASKDYIYNCGECVHGAWTINDSYVNSNGMVGTGDHLEDWYFNDGTVSANHDTMLNAQGPTAILFGDTSSHAGGPADNHITFTNSLVAGGGFMFYPYGNASSVGTGTMNISNNRFSRCLLNGAAAIVDSAGGRTCPGTTIGNNDGHGYYPYGGYYGVADFYSSGSCQIWTGNIWDDNQATVNISDGGSLAGATVLPPATGSCSTTPTSPTISLTAPTAGSTINGTVAVAATAAATTSGASISSVQFKLDGQNLGSADTSAPYSVNWNTSTASNASHSLTAVATDSNNQSTTSSAVTVTVNNASTCTTGTLAPPTALTKGAVTYTSIALSWTAPSPTSGCSITGYKVFRNGTQVGTTTGATTYTDSGLTSGTSYAYSVQATDSGPNTSAQSTTANATTTADNLAPSVPGSVSVTGTTAGSVGLGWSASTDNPNPGGSGVKGYNVYRNGSSTPLNATPLTGTTYSDTTVSASTSYTYVITAIDNTSNESAPSTVANATTPAPTCSGTPSVPGGLHATAETLNSVSFAWTASTASAGCTLSGYHVYRGGTLVTDVTSATSFTNSGLSPNTSYSYTLAAFDTSGHTSAQTSAVSIATTPDTTAPTAPGSVTATATGSAQVNLAWTAGTDNVGITGYKVYRSDKGAVALATLSGSTLTYSDTTVAANTSYTYQVSALDAANNESPKTTATPNPVHTPAATDTTAPSAPTNLAAPVIASQAASLSWTAATDNVAVAGYHVYLNGIYDGDSSSTSFALSCIAPGVSYTATVKAFDASGNVSTTAATKTFSSLSGGLSGDLDCNGTVNSTDLFTLLRNWQATDALPPSGDVTGDATVNSTDLFDLLRNWGKSA